MAAITLDAGTPAVLVASGGALSATNSELSAEYDNAVAGEVAAWCEVVGTFGSAPSGGTVLSVYLIPALDGTNYGDGSASVSPSAGLLVGQGSVRAVTTAQRVPIRGLDRRAIELPPHRFKLLVKNDATTALSAGWTLTLYPFHYQSA